MQSIIVKIKDETGAGKIYNEIDLTFEQDTITVKDLIEARVTEEVRRYNVKLPDYFSGLIQPTDTEKTLNGYRMRHRKPIDGEKQVYIALDAFLKNGYFVLVDNKQAESLDQEIMLSPKTQVSFVKLTPLVGG